MLRTHWLPIAAGLIFSIALCLQIFPLRQAHTMPLSEASSYDPFSNCWSPPDINLLPYNEETEKIRYGQDLFAHTSYYFGPKGTIAAITNGMSCQNCHLSAGMVNYANCLSAVAANYPSFKFRSGITESVAFRINDCMQRSLNGSMLDSNSKEMQAMVAYILWLGKDVPRGVRPVGAGTEELPYLDRAADTARGRIVYASHCSRCHGDNGEGAWNADRSGFIYPPLWGEHSYNAAAGMYRISRLAAYVKNNMPRDSATHTSNVLSVEQSWDVAAYINSMPRPEKHFAEDWPDIRKKPVDLPTGPFADAFPEKQHKYGPFKPIVAAIRK